MSIEELKKEYAKVWEAKGILYSEFLENKLIELRNKTIDECIAECNEMMENTGNEEAIYAYGDVADNLKKFKDNQ